MGGLAQAEPASAFRPCPGERRGLEHPALAGEPGGVRKALQAETLQAFWPATGHRPALGHRVRWRQAVHAETQACWRFDTRAGLRSAGGLNPSAGSVTQARPSRCAWAFPAIPAASPRS